MGVGGIALPDVATATLLLWWLRALTLTLAVELPVCVAVLWPDRPSVRRVLAAAALATLCTHPVLWFVAPALFDDYGTYFVVGEVVVTLVEAVVLRGAVPTSDAGTALFASACMNGASVAVGALLQPILY